MKKALLLLTAMFISLYFFAAGQTAMAAGYSNEFVDIDTSNTENGYIAVKVTKATDKNLRVRITKGDKTYTYVLTDNKAYNKFPLQMESGTYSVKVLENTTGNKYATLHATDIPVTITDPFAPFTISHVLVNYDAAPHTVGMARQLTAGSDTDLAKLEVVYANIVDNIKYDHDLAAKITSGAVTSYVPDVDAVYTSNKGICFDYSAVMGSMLRSQGIPTRMVMGYVAPNNLYHAWNEVYITTMGWVKVRGTLQIDSYDWSRMDATFAASSGYADLTSFIGDGSNYKTTEIY